MKLHCFVCREQADRTRDRLQLREDAMEGERTTRVGKQEEVSWEKQEMMAGMNREQTADICSKYKSA